MITNKKIKAIFSLFIALIVVYISSHCIFEDAYTVVSEILFGIEGSSHLENHLGANHSHKHEDSSESHKHGEPHPLTAIHFDKTISDFVKLVVAIVPLCFFLVSTFCIAASVRTLESLLLFSTGDPPKIFGNLIACLSLAPQAPPI